MSLRLSNHMITLKIQYTKVSDFTSFLKECNKVKRIAFNLFKEKEDKTYVTRKIKNNYIINHNLVDSAILEYQVNDAYALYKSTKALNNKTTIFGSLLHWKRFNKGIITKEEWQTIKDTQPVLFTGRSNEIFGNRKFKLDINNKQIIFKKSRNEHFNLKLITSNSHLEMLEKLQLLFETSSTPITYKLDNKYIWISFDESILKDKEHAYKENRIGSLDLNPNYIAFTIQDFDDNSDTVYRAIYDLTRLNNTFNKNKKDYEIVQIAKQISKLCKHYNVEIVGLEQLVISSKNHNKGRKLNRLINNTWNKNCFVNNLKKRLNILGIKHQNIIPSYSSTVGCLDNPTETDSIAASLEIGRRAFVFLNKLIKKKKEFLDKDILFPKIDRVLIKERWNSILSDYNPANIGYKGIHNYLKEKKKLNELRFHFKDYNFNLWRYFRLLSSKSLVIGFTIS